MKTDHLNHVKGNWKELQNARKSRLYAGTNIIKRLKKYTRHVGKIVLQL